MRERRSAHDHQQVDLICSESISGGGSVCLCLRVCVCAGPSVHCRRPDPLLPPARLGFSFAPETPRHRHHQRAASSNSSRATSNNRVRRAPLGAAPPPPWPPSSSFTDNVPAFGRSLPRKPAKQSGGESGRRCKWLPVPMVRSVESAIVSNAIICRLRPFIGTLLLLLRFLLVRLRRVNRAGPRRDRRDTWLEWNRAARLE